MKTYYYIGPNNEAQGPHSGEELRRLANQGVLRAQTLVAANGDSEWKPWKVVQEEVVASGAEKWPDSPGVEDSGEPLKEQTSGAASKVPAEERIRKTLKDALRAFKLFATNPVGGLPVACQSLEPGSVLGVGVAFGIVNMACLLWAAHSGLGKPFKELLTPNVLLALAVPFVALAASSFLVRTVARAGGTHGTDCFISGAALLPSGFLALAAALLGEGNLEVTAVLAVFAGCLTVLMLFSGCHRISQLSERAATFAVPIMLLATAWLMKIIYASWLQRLFRNMDLDGVFK